MLIAFTRLQDTALAIRSNVDRNTMLTKAEFVPIFLDLATLCTEELSEANKQIYLQLQLNQAKMNPFNIRAIYGAIQLYSKLTSLNLQTAKDDTQPRSALVREWIWGLYTSLFHTQLGSNIQTNNDGYKNWLVAHLGTKNATHNPIAQADFPQTAATILDGAEDLCADLQLFEREIQNNFELRA